MPTKRPSMLRSSKMPLTLIRSQIHGPTSSLHLAWLRAKTPQCFVRHWQRKTTSNIYRTTKAGLTKPSTQSIGLAGIQYLPTFRFLFTHSHLNILTDGFQRMPDNMSLTLGTLADAHSVKKMKLNYTFSLALIKDSGNKTPSLRQNNSSPD